MVAHHFSPHTTERRPCWHCRHFGEMLYGGSAAACTAPNGTRVRALPAGGCAAFEREVGTDDEAGPPALETVPRAFGVTRFAR
jgi:hypothetical protein